MTNSCQKFRFKIESLQKEIEHILFATMYLPAWEVVGTRYFDLSSFLASPLPHPPPPPPPNTHTTTISLTLPLSKQRQIGRYYNRSNDWSIGIAFKSDLISFWTECARLSEGTLTRPRYLHPKEAIYRMVHNTPVYLRPPGQAARGWCKVNCCTGCLHRPHTSVGGR